MPYKPLSAGFFVPWDTQSHQMMEQYASQAEALYQNAIKEFAKLATKAKGVNPDKPFRFEDYPQTRTQAQKMLNQLAGQLQGQVLDGQAKAWTLSNAKNDALVDAIVKVTSLKKSDVVQYYQQNLQALSAFQTRKENGLRLSDRVWKYTTQFKNEIETGLDVGLGEGKSAADLARDLKKYLQQPDKLFRRVRDEKGQLHLSKAAKAYHPGQGVYRSSTKNAQRLSRTEVNMAYRTSDAERWAQMDFILGVEVKTSRNHPVVDICDTLAGKYPKDFKFVGFHPQCRCYAIPIMADEDDFDAMQMAILNGENPGKVGAKGVITELPPNFRAWVKENADKIAAAKTPPYFIRDNQKLINAIKPEAPAKTFVFSEQSIKSLGWQLDDSAESINEVIGGFDLQEFSRSLDAIEQKYGIKIPNRTLRMSPNGAVMVLISDADNTLNLIRTFKRKNGALTVNHFLFEVPETLQGKGLSRDMFQALYAQYKNANVARIDVHANLDIGGYAWGKYGFFLTDPSKADMFTSIARRKLAKKQFADYSKWLKEAKATGVADMNKLANREYGKELLLGSDWTGYLDLTSPVQRQYFEDYIYRR